MVGWWVVQHDKCCVYAREGFPKVSEFLKRNWPGAARIYFIKGNHGYYNGAKPAH